MADENFTPRVKRNRLIEVGASVNLVFFEKGRKNVPAIVEKVYAGGRRVDLVLDEDHPDKRLRFNGCPRDDTGHEIGSWHPMPAT